MKNFICFIISFSLLLSSYGQITLRPNLPKAIFPGTRPEYKGDSLLFNILIKNDSIITTSLEETLTIKNVSQIEDFYCKMIKNKSLASPNVIYNNYYISFFVDSATPYKNVDVVFEELKLIKHREVYLKTNNDGDINSGMDVYLFINTENRQKIAANLYGASFLKVKNITFDCVAAKENKSEISGPPSDLPPPPPEAPPYDPLDEYLQMKRNKVDTNYYFIERNKGILLVNGKQSDKVYLSEIIYKKNSKLFIKLNKDNVYNDLIKILDVLYHAQYMAFDKESKHIYNKNFINLSRGHQVEILRMYPLQFLILSLTDQIYITKKKL